MRKKPRRRIKTNYAARVFYQRVIWDEMTPGGFISDVIIERTGGRDLGLRIPLLLCGYLRHMNGRTGTTFVSLAKLAQDMGYSGNGHDLTKCRNLLVKSGFLTKTKGRGNGAEYALSIPVDLVEKYDGSNGEEYEDITDHLEPEVYEGDIPTTSHSPQQGAPITDPWAGTLV